MNLKKALEDALKEGNIKIVQKLIDFGVNVKDGSVLFMAIYYAHEGTKSLNTIKLLLENGADVDGPRKKLTPLQIFLSKRHTKFSLLSYHAAPS